MKKIISIILLTCLTFASFSFLAGCSRNQKNAMIVTNVSQDMYGDIYVKLTNVPQLKKDDARKVEIAFDGGAGSVWQEYKDELTPFALDEVSLGVGDKLSVVVRLSAYKNFKASDVSLSYDYTVLPIVQKNDMYVVYFGYFEKNPTAEKPNVFLHTPKETGKYQDLNININEDERPKQKYLAFVKEGRLYVKKLVVVGDVYSLIDIDENDFSIFPYKEKNKNEPPNHNDTGWTNCSNSGLSLDEDSTFEIADNPKNSVYESKSKGVKLYLRKNQNALNCPYLFNSSKPLFSYTYVYRD